MRRLVPVALVLLTLGGLAEACLNDRDTSAETVRRLPAVVDVITGRFARNVPFYYEMRLERVASEIGSNPDALDLYDDAAVAADRLGRHDEAIDWMERKRARMEAMGSRAGKEAWYRYHANVGTHWVHRWLTQGADRERLDEVRTARDHIAEAIAIKPDAHFGRERFQLQAIEWILAGPELIPNPARYPSESQLPLSIDTTWTDATPREAVEGLCGLIVLGNAWESVDTFLALAVALEAMGEPGLGYMARLRCEELIDAGRGSLVADTPRGEDLKALLGHRGWAYLENAPNSSNQLEVRFRNLRFLANAHNTERDRFMRERLETGRHPDTDPTFWDGAPAVVLALRGGDGTPGSPVIRSDYVPPTRDVLYQYGRLRLGLSARQERRIIATVVAVIALIVLAPTALVVWLWRRHRARAAKPKHPLDEFAPDQVAV